MSAGIGLLITALVLVIAVVIVRAMRTVLLEIEPKGKRKRVSSGDEGYRLLQHLKTIDVRCPKCKQESLWVLGSTDRYKCVRCSQEFTGPARPKLTDG